MEIMSKHGEVIEYLSGGGGTRFERENVGKQKIGRADDIYTAEREWA